MSMKVWLVTIGEPVPIGSGAQDRLLRIGAFAAFLSNHGHEVTWWTSTFDHFRKRHYFNSDTSILIKENLRIQLIHGCGYERNVSLRRIRDHYKVAKIFAKLILLEEGKPDIILTSFPTESLCLESVRYGRRFQIPVVLDMRDMWPDILVDTFPKGIKGIARIFLAPFFRQAVQACKGATAITGITEEFVDWGLKKADRAKSRMDKSFPLGYKPSAPSDADLKQAEAYWDGQGVHCRETRFHVCFFGTLGRQLDVDAIINAAQSIWQKNIPVFFVLCGSGERLVEYQKKAEMTPNVLLPGRVDAAQIYVLMRRSYVGLDPLPDRYDFLATINNKAVEYFSAGLPVVSSPNKGVLADFLKEYQCGLTYPTGESKDLAGHLISLYHDRALLDNMSCKAGIVFDKFFTSEKVHRNMMNYLTDIIGGYRG